MKKTSTAEAYKPNKIQTLIIPHLIAALEANTVLFRDLITKKPEQKKELSDQAKRLIEAIKFYADNHSQSTARQFAPMFAAAADAPEILDILNKHYGWTTVAAPFPEPLSVVCVTTNKAGHYYTVGKLYIVKHARYRQLYHEIPGNENNIDNDFIIATSEEVKQCVAELNAAQWRQILTDELFAPIVEQALA